MAMSFVCESQMLFEKLDAQGHFSRLRQIPVNITEEVSSDFLRFVCVSDTHNSFDYNTLPPGDVLIHAGDFSFDGRMQDVINLNKTFGALPFRRILLVPGNHDLCLDELFYNSRSKKLARLGLNTDLPDPLFARSLLTSCDLLIDRAINICGLNIYGSPWLPQFLGWAFGLKRGEELKSKWNQIPDNTDVLITHTPPLGIADLCWRGSHVGCADLLDTVQCMIKPKFHVFGHIHEGYGCWTDGNTTYLNASICDIDYSAVNKPLVFDVPIPDGHDKSQLTNEKLPGELLE